jgi:hypothetical protein
MYMHAPNTCLHAPNTHLHAPARTFTYMHSPITYVHTDCIRVRKYTVRLLGLMSGDSFIESFAKISREHPGFIIFSQIGMVTVISVQSAFMLSQLVKDRVLDGPINGVVNDAAHGWWRERNSLLIVTSTYSPDIFCWVPGVLSYTNGASADHFMYHFLGIFQSMATEAERRNIPVIDLLFAGVSHSINFRTEFDRNF